MDLKPKISESAVNYFILSFLPTLQIIRLGLLNKRFYDLYAPVTLHTVTIAGSVPVSNTRRNIFVLRTESRRDLLMLDIPRSKRDSKYLARSEFWASLKWTRQLKFTKFKRGKMRGGKKPFAFNNVSWSTAVTVD